MEIDVILLTYTKNHEIFIMTKNCIESINKSEKNYKFNIILIETDKTGVYKYDYNNVKTIVPNEEFNYNRFLNIGLLHSKNEWVLITNNDTEYTKGWLTEMISHYNDDNNLLSMSPYCPIWNRHTESFGEEKIYYGYRTSYEVTGWSILMNKEILNKVGNFDESFTFWYQDNDYALSLKNKGIKHGLIRNSIVYHFLSKSHNLIDYKKKREMTHGLEEVFTKKWSQKK